MLNQINTFTLFGYPLKPDLIISHHGANDVITGLITDNNLINEYQITYPDVQETWGKTLHDSHMSVNYDYADPASSNFKPVEIQCYPDAVAKAYIMRAKQFRLLVEGLNIKFISGFQPICSSKPNLSPIEVSNIDGYNPYYKNNYLASKYTYELADRAFQNSEAESQSFVNIHRYFNQLDSSEVHFGDHHHLTALGNMEVAKCYTSVISKMYNFL